MIRSVLAAASLAVVVAGGAAIGLSAPASDAQSSGQAQARNAKAATITWDDLLPEGEEDKIAALYEEYFRKLQADGGSVEEGSAADAMVQIGTYNTVAGFNNRLVRLPGYIVPLDFNAKGEFKEFLLVPYFGACIHSPPPPPNQIVYVASNPAAKIKDTFGAVWIEGVMTTTRKDNSLGNAAYTIQLRKVEAYDG